MSIPIPPLQPPDEAVGTDLPGDDPRRPSKTRRKKDMHALQTLGEKLVDVADEKLVALELPERLVDAIREARVTRSHEGRRRQMQFVGKLMRDVDPAEIEAMLAIDADHHRAQVRAMQEAERWRDALLSGQRSLTQFIDQYPAGARAGLPQLLAQARREQQQSRPPRNQRALYRELHRLIESARIAAARPAAGETSDTAGSGDADVADEQAGTPIHDITTGGARPQ